ncbi:hypothetical protein FOZ63_025204, partial [Perkinsus olseni]
MSRPTYTAILRKVTDRLKPTLINIIDDSAKHASHAPMRGRDRLETHFRVEVVSDGFKGLNRVQRQKLMYSILSEEMDCNPVVIAITSDWSPDKFTNNGRLSLYHRGPQKLYRKGSGLEHGKCGEAYRFDLPELAYALTAMPTVTPSPAEERLGSREVLRGEALRVAVSLRSSPTARSAVLYEISKDAQGFHHHQLGSVKTSSPVS